MVSSYTPNKYLEKPANNDYIDDWNVPNNGDWDVVDQAFGGSTSLSVTGVSATPVTLTTTQYRSLILNISGTLTANVTYQLPSGVGGQWVVNDTTTGAFTVTISSLGGGTYVTTLQGKVVNIYSDGTNVKVLASPVSSVGGTGSLQYNNAGQFAGSANLTFDGTNVTDSVGTFIDSIGTVRAVPFNNQSTSYTLASSDAGKMIVSTGGGITINTGVFSIGQNVTFFNNTNTTVTITQGSGATLILVGAGTTGNRSVAAYGLTTLLSIATDTYIITGNGVS